jgi:CxxC-x17-CxxC domain-containing protein
LSETSRRRVWGQRPGQLREEQQYLIKSEGIISMFEDKTLVCKECGGEFVFTVGEQEFYAEKGFQNEPARCKPCRDARKANGRRGVGGRREMHDAVCAECGAPTQVPFIPKNDRPIYCSECFQNYR